jgi:transcriptional regulator with XRE-family HTH domain
MLSRELKALRALHGYTQKQLAEKLNMGETSYNKRENGDLSFSVEEIKCLKNILNLKDEDVMRIFFTDEVALKATEINHAI